jgi:hypothetical protein
MIRSGSTWSFNVALNLIRRCCPERKVYGFYNESPAVHRASARPRDSHLVIKAHYPDSFALDLCRSGVMKAIYTWRDPYDVVASAMQAFDIPIEAAIAALRNALRVWSSHKASGNACVVSYESIVRTPAATISAIAAYLGLSVFVSDVHGLADLFSFERLKTYTQHVDELDPSQLARSSGFVYDRETLLHSNHIRNGSIGYGARLLTPAQIALVEAALVDEGFQSLVKLEAAA